MTGRTTKRKIGEEADDDMQEAKQSKTDEVQIQVSSRSGRARKKSAKLLEMEAFEEEVASSTAKGRKKAVKVQEPVEAATVTPLPINVKKSPKTSPATSRKKGKVTFHTDTITTEDVGELEIKEEPEPQVKEASALKLMLTIPKKQESDINMYEGNTVSQNVAETDTIIKVEEETPKPKAKKKSSKKSKAKTVKEEVTSDSTMILNEPLPELESPQMKEELSSPYSGLGAVDDLADDVPLVVAEKNSKKKKQQSKKKVKKTEPPPFQPALLNFDPETSEKMEMLDYSEFVDTVTGMKDEEEEESSNIDVEKTPPTNPKKKSVPKKKSPPKSTSKSKPAASGFFEKSKAKKKNPALNPDKTPKKRTTAYTLWCNNMRKQLMVQYPDSDFAHISRKLAELWQTVSVAEKDSLRRRARKIQKKQDMGKDVPVNILPVSTHMRSGQSQQIERIKPIVYTPQQSPPQPQSFKITGNAPIDVAAHLKLLGESLGTIGARLQEHRGQIAVQGSLSVLLDSMLCALGPLLCLTNQVPELNSVPTHIHKRTLDNIAYIMPGIG